MPVKVRCPGCEKVLNAPDAARGKQVRCPKCETAVKIPVAEKKKRVKQAAPDSEYGFLQLDLHEAEDRRSRICPACGERLDDDDQFCPACGVDYQTGQLPEREMKIRQRGGPDPRLFYKAAWSDSWDYMKKQKKLVYRTFGYWVLLASLLAGCLFMVDYCTDRVLVIFWMAVSVVVSLAFPGWIWTLTVRIVVASAGKKRLDRINFDIFLNIAYGIKWVLWYVAFFLPAAVVALPLLLIDQTAFLAAFAGMHLPILCLVPTAMGHMSMPVTTKGWLSPVLVPTALRNFGHSSWWVLIFLTVMIVCFAPLAGGTVPYIAELTGTLQNGTQFPTMGAVIIISCAVVSHILFSYGAIFLMRATGLFAYYNKNRLDLVTSVKEQEYVPRDQLYGSDETIMQGSQAGMILLIASALGLAGGGIAAMVLEDEFTVLRGLGTGLGLAGVAIGFVGRWSLSQTAYNVSTNWGHMVRYVPFAETAFIFIHFQKAKFPALLQLFSFLYIVGGLFLMYLGEPEQVGVKVEGLQL